MSFTWDFDSPHWHLSVFSSTCPCRGLNAGSFLECRTVLTMKETLFKHKNPTSCKNICAGELWRPFCDFFRNVFHSWSSSYMYCIRNLFFSLQVTLGDCILILKSNAQLEKGWGLLSKQESKQALVCFLAVTVSNVRVLILSQQQAFSGWVCANGHG